MAKTKPSAAVDMEDSQKPPPTLRSGDIDEALTTLKKMSAMLSILAAVDPKGDNCIGQSDLAEVFGVLLRWSSEALEELEGFWDVEQGA